MHRTISIYKKVFNDYQRIMPALNGVSFRLNASECIGILGINGSGKLKIVRILACEHRSTLA